MKKTKFFNPYTKDGKTTFPDRKRSGVYLIKEDGKLVYVGFFSIDLYKTMYRHFQKWNHRFQEVVTYSGTLSRKNYTVRVVYCTPKQAESLEKMLIKRHKPRDNAQQYIDFEPKAYDQATFKIYGTKVPMNRPDEAPW